MYSDVYKLQMYADKYELYFKIYDKIKRVYKQNITNEKRNQIDAFKKWLSRRTTNILLINSLIIVIYCESNILFFHYLFNVPRGTLNCG